jgi:hypothetical protein
MNRDKLCAHLFTYYISLAWLSLAFVPSLVSLRVLFFYMLYYSDMCIHESKFNLDDKNFFLPLDVYIILCSTRNKIVSLQQGSTSTRYIQAYTFLKQLE